MAEHRNAGQREQSLSARRAWIEIELWSTVKLAIRSLSARRAWIEMILRGEGLMPGIVALRKESVDRNRRDWGVLEHNQVALRKESVDRNNHLLRCSYTDIASLSARRAWIEINMRGFSAEDCKVALRKESVDRNNNTALPAF